MKPRPRPEPERPEPAFTPEPEAVEFLTRLVYALPERIKDWDWRDPVVQEFGNVIGVGSHYEAAKVCWPDRALYLAWLLNPFASLSGPGLSDPYGFRRRKYAPYLWPSQERQEQAQRAVAAAERHLRDRRAS